MLKRWLLFPVLVSIYPALNLYATNAATIDPQRGLLPIALIALFMAVLTWTINRFIRQSTSAGIMALAVGVFLFYYGYVFDLLAALLPINHLILLIVWVFALIVVILEMRRRRPIWPQVNLYLNYVGLILIALPLLTLMMQALNASPVPAIAAQVRHGTPIEDRITLTTPPDVYYIIADGYGRDDVLRHYYNYDNSAFLAALETRGFVIPEASCSNYPATYLALASSLNMDFADVLRPSAQTRPDIYPLIQRNLITRLFDELGYTTIQFATIWEPTRSNSQADIIYKYDTIEPYYQLVGEMTLARPFLIPDIGDELTVLNHLSVENQRTITTSTFAELNAIPAIDAPTFTFAHLIVPHPPFLFDQDGSIPERMQSNTGIRDMGWWLFEEGYIDQIIYTNTQLLDVVDTILATSSTPPIIIIQGDHGPAIHQDDDPTLRRQARLPILNAYYLPGGGDAHIYPTITPVNTFRLILDLYFGSDWGLLDDKIYHSDTASDSPVGLEITTCDPFPAP